MQCLDYGEMALSAYTFLLGCGALLLLFTVCYVLGGCVTAPRNSAPALGIGARGETARSTERGEAPAWQGVTREHIGHM